MAFSFRRRELAPSAAADAADAAPAAADAAPDVAENGSARRTLELLELALVAMVPQVGEDARGEADRCTTLLRQSQRHQGEHDRLPCQSKVEIEAGGATIEAIAYDIPADGS